MPYWDIAVPSSAQAIHEIGTFKDAPVDAEQEVGVLSKRNLRGFSGGLLAVARDGFDVGVIVALVVSTVFACGRGWVVVASVVGGIAAFGSGSGRSSDGRRCITTRTTTWGPRRRLGDDETNDNDGATTRRRHKATRATTTTRRHQTTTRRRGDDETTTTTRTKTVMTTTAMKEESQ